MSPEETVAWMWALNDAFIETGTMSQPTEDVDFWMLWLGSLGVEGNGTHLILEMLNQVPSRDN